MDGVTSALRPLHVLDWLTAIERPAPFGEIGAALDTPRSSMSELLRTMTDAGWLRLDPHTRSYTIGIQAMEAGNAY